MANNRDLSDLPLDIYTDAMLAGMSYSQITAAMCNLSLTCRAFHGLFKTVLPKRKIIQLLSQAVIDDDRKAVVKIATARPDLLLQLLIGMPKGFDIESKYTFQKFNLEDENILTVVVKRKQIKMIETLLSCFAKLKQTDHVWKMIAKALSQWSFYELRKNQKGIDEIVIPEEYASYAQSLIKVFNAEAFPNGVKGQWSKKTELAHLTLFNRLLPEQAVKLDDYPDMELFLLAFYRAYYDKFGVHRNMIQRDAFCILVIGLIQSVLTPETAKILCASLVNIVTALEMGEKYELNKEANEHKLRDGTRFYRLARDLDSGLGRDFLVNLYGVAREPGESASPLRARARSYRAAGAAEDRGRALEKLCRAKTAMFWNITQQFQHQLIQHSVDHKRSGCTIL